MARLHEYGGLLLGSRLKRVSEALYAGVDTVYAASGIDLPSRSVPILLLLRDGGPLAITELAKELGQSHAAVSQLSRTLVERGVVKERSDPADDRRRLLALSPAGQSLLRRMEPIWKAVVAAVDELSAATGLDFLAALTAFDQALEQRGFAARIGDRLRLAEAAAVEIIAYQDRYRDDFKRLNVEWLERHFYVEDIDHQVLSNPEQTILKPGGFIFLARYTGASESAPTSGRARAASGRGPASPPERPGPGAGPRPAPGEIVGTCALIKAGRSRFELSKMAVTERYQGLGIGRRLLETAVQQFRKTGARELFLESNRKLAPALRLYESSGFHHAPRPRQASHYQRSNVYMVYRGPRKRQASA
jgi:GNAT superfamily N-acetyltransferase/DNA-binding MarR family transcriptional regulator